MYRWLPKEQRSVEYYVHEYRFQKDDVIKAFAYSYNHDSSSHAKSDPPLEVTLLGALSGTASALFALTASVIMLNF